MGVVFVVLALLAIAIKGISLLDRETAPAAAPEPEPVSGAPAQSAPEGITGQQVAAIAVALALSEGSPVSIPRSISKAGQTAGSWVQSGRIRVLGSGTSSARERRN